MRVITIEEHAFDPGIGWATRALQAAGAGYQADLDAGAEDKASPAWIAHTSCRPAR